jgi:hypothetical protein
MRRMTNDDEDAYFYARQKVWKTVDILKEGDNEDEELTHSFFVRAQRFKSIQPAYGIPFEENVLPSSSVGVWFINQLDNTITNITPTEYEIKWLCILSTVNCSRTSS